MNIISNEILLLKSPSDGDDKFEPLLTQNGFSVKYLQVLEFVFVNLSVLAEKLHNTDDYSGIVFTSPRSVIATKMCQNGATLSENWYTKNNFVVGESTFGLVKKELGLICKGSETGNANNLAELIVTDIYQKPFLFPCGNLKKETLQHRLKEHNIKMDAVTVYETKPNRNLIDNFCKLTSNFTNISEFVLFFSPSGVKYMTEIFRKLPLDRIKLIAIGPTTEKALKDENLSVFSVALKPTDIEVFNALKKSI